MAVPEKGLLEGLNFKQVPRFLKSNLISPAYGLTGNKGQTFIDKSCFLFLLYQEYADIVPFSGVLGA